MCILVLQKGWRRKNFIIFNSLKENEKKLTLLPFIKN